MSYHLSIAVPRNVYVQFDYNYEMHSGQVLYIDHYYDKVHIACRTGPFAGRVHAFNIDWMNEVERYNPMLQPN